MTDKTLSSIDDAITAFRSGQFVIIVDDEDRENEGDLTIAAEHITPEAVNFMATHGKGLICLAMQGAMLDRLKIPMMVPQNQNRSGFGTGFTVSIEAATGVTTGISAQDRSHTIQTLINPKTTPPEIAMPGHVFPIRARDGGVLERRGQTEASVDLAKLAGLSPAASICEVMSRDGTMARLPELLEFATTHDLHVISVEALVQYRLASEARNAPAATTESKTIRIGTSKLPTRHGDFLSSVYRDEQGLEHMALVCGDIERNTPLVRMHSECLTGDAFSSLRCDCGEQLDMSLRKIAEDGNGILIYLRQEGRGIGLGNKIRAYELQDGGMDTVEANTHLGFPEDAREYDVAAAMLSDLNVSKLRLITNNPLKTESLEKLGLDVTEQVPLIVKSQQHNKQYLNTKAQKMRHALPVISDEEEMEPETPPSSTSPRQLDCTPNTNTDSHVQEYLI